MRSLLDEFKGSTAVGYWHDFGHVQRKANLGLVDHEQWLGSVANDLIGCHLHDVVWPDRDHQVPFQGSIDYEPLISSLPAGVPLVWEINPRHRSAHIKSSLERWKERFPPKIQSL